MNKTNPTDLNTTIESTEAKNQALLTQSTAEEAKTPKQLDWVTEPYGKQKQKKSTYRKPKRPTRLTGKLPLEIHTQEAQLLFAGKLSSQNDLGLLRFGGQMSAIWDAAAKDDPYADWYLLKVYDAVIKLRRQLTEATTAYQQQIEQTYGAALAPFASYKPFTKPLWFRTQYGYLGAQILADFDRLMRVAFTANSIGILLDHDPEFIKDRWSKKIALLFKRPFQWQDLEITRADFEENNEKAKQAILRLGRLPEGVLKKTLRAPFAPPIIKPTDTNEDIIKQETIQQTSDEKPPQDTEPSEPDKTTDT